MVNGNKSDVILVKGVREYNPKDISFEIPRDKLVVFTGFSGSGKSSLAFRTLHTEAQRHYLESVSPYVRMLFNHVNVPEVYSTKDCLPQLPYTIRRFKKVFSRQT
jgi:excinuclease ABC subunit A